MSPRTCRPDWRVVVNLKIHRPIPHHPHAGRVAAMFGLSQGHTEELYKDFRLDFSAGEIVAVVGPSGSGKSMLLKQVARQVRDSRQLRIAKFSGSGLPAVELLKTGTLAERLEVLSRCGLAEALALITPAKCLSGGQLHRLAIAEAVHAAGRSGRGRLVIADEFCSPLDGETAVALCRRLRKLIAGSNVAMLVATAREELLAHLQPDRVIAKPLGEPATVTEFERGRGDSPSIRRCRITRGTIADYESLSRFHYLGKRPAAHKRIYIVRPPAGSRSSLSAPTVAAVLVVSPPLVNVRGRNLALAGRYTGPDRVAAMSLLNRELECISRVIVHPSYRGSGLAVRLVRHAVKTAETPMVEALAAMGAVHPFFELAGMTAYHLRADRHMERLISAAEAVGLSREDLAAVAPVKRLLKRHIARSKFLRSEIQLAVRRTMSARQLACTDDPVAEVCRRTSRQYVYYLSRRKEFKSCRTNPHPRARAASNWRT